MKKNKIYSKKNFPNKKKFFYTIFFIFLVFIFFYISIKIFENKKISQKNLEIEKILTWSIEEYKNIYWEYPKNLEKIEEKNIINDINILKNKKNILYKNSSNNILNNNSSWFILKILK